MVKQYNKSGIGQIMVEAVPEDKIPMYGIADCNGKNPKPLESVPIKGMVEKPSAKEAPSNLAIVGRYILPKQTMNILMDTQPDAGNEVQLTNALETLLNHQSLQAFRMHGTTFDCGNKLGYLLANVHMGMEHPEIGEGFVKALRSMLDIK